MIEISLRLFFSYLVSYFEKNFSIKQRKNKNIIVTNILNS